MDGRRPRKILVTGAVGQIGSELTHALRRRYGRDMCEKGISVVGSSFPIVPRDAARIWVQLCAGHQAHHIDRAIKVFTQFAEQYGILGKGRDEIVAQYGL